jgi:hypothetical protein
MATRTGGEFLRETEARNIGKLVKASKADWVAPASIPSLNPLAYFIFITALCAEWTIRRRQNLS